MKSRNWILLVAGLVLIASAAGALSHFKARQRLGAPGLKYAAIPGDLRVNLELPMNVPGYAITSSPPDKVVVDTLPPDTSIAQATYTDTASQSVHVNAVMMGTDRTSIHKPEICLPGQGFSIDPARTRSEIVHIDGPKPFELPVMKVISTKTIELGGRPQPVSGVYVYWFVADNAVTEDHNERMWWMARHLLQTGELQRWAYISYFSVCLPGAEDATFERIKRLMNVTVPEFQLARPASTQEQASIR